MKFDTPVTTDPIDQLKVIGKPTDRIDGPLKTTGTAPYAYERHDVVPNQAYGYILGSAIAKGRIDTIDMAEAKAVPGVITIVTWQNAGKLGKSRSNTAKLLAGPDIEHYDQTIALVVAETFEQARAAARLIRVDYVREKGRFDLADQIASAPPTGGNSGEGSAAPSIDQVGNFEGAFAAAPVKIDETYTTPDQSHAMMEPHASIAAWQGDALTVWTSSQMIAWAVRDLAATLQMPREKIRVISPYIGGGFGAKLWIRSDALLAALGARATGRPVKVALAGPQVINNTVHRPATIQRLRIGASRDGKISAIAHESW
jgi:xanthine dehydrogenase YagR molybdenum-binding subunit